MNAKDYMLKGEPVSQFYFNTGNGDRRVFTPMKVLGRTYHKIGELQAVGFYGEAYECWDSDKNKKVLKLFVGISKQHPNDKFNKQVAMEVAHENMLMNPEIVIEWPRKYIRRFEFITLCKTYLSMMKLEFVKTKEEKEKENIDAFATLF